MKSCVKVISCASVESRSTPSSMYGAQRTYNCNDARLMMAAKTMVFCSEGMNAARAATLD